MYLSELHFIHFKNWAELKLSLHPKINCLVGENGSGKTNVLDGIHYLCTTKSYLNSIDAQNIQDGADFMLLQTAIHKGEEQYALSCSLKRGQKKVFKRNKKEYERLADHIGQFPCVIISPYDRDLITDGSELRRKFMDGVIAQSDVLYLEQLLHYNKLLQQRNALLKFFAANRRFDKDSLEAFDHQLATQAPYLIEKRREFCDKLNARLQFYYAAISGGRERAELEYRGMKEGESLEALLAENHAKDRALQYTSVGPHKDDLKFVLDGKRVKKFGSQGQQKSFVLALRLAQYEFIRNKQNLNPLLLLDDIFDKLDEKRVAALMELVAQNAFGQIFITDTDVDRVERLAAQVAPDAHIVNTADLKTA